MKKKKDWVAVLSYRYQKKAKAAIWCMRRWQAEMAYQKWRDSLIHTQTRIGR